ncbi:probable maleylacetoacetate isomerase 2 [Ceratitis capitata]|uniref:(Mediterranean fruit fly) hypothetical protein n=1 Tax=Ceratitis capitata TaxID=7213 RepID=A0A811UAT6_CERCA|nr:probable maleylacetoacetate isomerase 2 [Ceratitis capitata]CAD6995057.1 unnamed protein product [Ceratitis capitata]
MNVVWCTRRIFQRPRLGKCNQIFKIVTKQITTTPIHPTQNSSNENTLPILYSYWHSSCSWRVRIALNFKNISYETRAINLRKPEGDQHTKEYSSVNPMHQVPTLVIDGHTIIESIAIINYLEETRPLPPLLPRDTYSRAKVREIVDIIASGIQPLQNLKVQKYIGKDKRKEWVQHWINSGFGALEKRLSTSAGKYCVGDEFSLADCCLMPQVFNAKKSEIDMRQYPIISRIETELEAVPAVIAAHPLNQPDCPTK